MNIESTQYTHVGQRDNNEDACCSVPDLGLFAVADGMGGYQGGEVASRLVVESLVEFFRANRDDEEITWPFGTDSELSFAENMVRVAIGIAQRSVLDRREGELGQMGSTVALVALRDDEATIGHVGDSRVYRLRGGELEQLTRDHSLYNSLRERDGEKMPAREDFPHRNVLVRALGSPTISAEPDLSKHPVRPGDTFLICSDGLFESLSREQIADHLAAPNIQEACETLVHRAIHQGSRDNVTAVILRAQEDV